MDQNTKELKYLEKIKNDIDERLYDLLIMHLVGHHVKVQKSGSIKDENEYLFINFTVNNPVK